MKKIFTLLVLITTLASFTVINLKPLDIDKAVTFSIKNFGIYTSGSFKGLKGLIKWDASNTSLSSINVSIDVNTVNTNVTSRDNHLREASYFNVAKYPVISFMSTTITPANITGNLTIKGITKAISFPYTIVPSGSGYIFQGSFTINRRDFGVGGSSMVLSDNVIVKLNVQTSQ